MMGSSEDVAVWSNLTRLGNGDVWAGRVMFSVLGEKLRDVGDAKVRVRREIKLELLIDDQVPGYLR